ncbi:MAG: hypothetical protein IPK50_13025 [Fibrobacterota bacterium]|nr:hypothetical protein [Fibrobacterota bacterium]QQS03231.1 MAG: hypothetical protein IPK50_13025 [Fibrobacterota bacterium]
MLKSKLLKIVGLIITVVAIVALILHIKDIPSSPRFINHQIVIAKFKPFDFKSDSCSQEKFETSGCPADKALSDLGCDDFLKPEGYISQIFESYPVVKCHVLLKDDSSTKTEGLYRVGGMMPLYARFAVFKPDGWRILKTAKDIRDELPPILTKNHALGYAAAATGFSANFGQAYKRGTEYAVDTIEDSYVREIPQGFQVALFDEEIFGCGPHWTYLVKLEISNGGEIREISRAKVSHETSLDNVCVD